MKAHLNFRLNLTNQGGLILDFLQKQLASHIQTNKLKSFRLASVGSGTGIIDAPLVEHVQKLCPVSYLGIEPNHHENAEAKKRMADILRKHSEAKFFPGIVEEFDASPHDAAFDAIIAVHVTYYSPDILPMIRKAMSMLHAKHGKLITIVSANTPQNELFRETTEALHGYVPFLFDRYKKALDDLGLFYETESIEAEIDIAGFVENPDSQSSKQFLDFFLHANSSSLSRDARRRYVDIICQAAVHRDSKLILPHIAKAVVAHSPSRH